MQPLKQISKFRPDMNQSLHNFSIQRPPFEEHFVKTLKFTSTQHIHRPNGEGVHFLQ